MPAANAPATDAWTGEFAARLRKAVAGISLPALAHSTGFAPVEVLSFLETGEPPSRFVASPCRALQISPEWLLQGQGEMKRVVGAVS